jgi:DNA-binding MarR family transcriptional regulator
MTAPQPDPDREEIMSRLMTFFAQTLDHQGSCLERTGLTYTQAKLVWRLEPGDLLPLKELAKRMGVDPSNAAVVVDQLSERGVVASRRADHDRRVRVIRLTGPGVRLRRQLVGCISVHPAIEALSPARRRDLLAILREVA